ncbi:response regulator transcription factor [Pseudomonas arsenicoxydans]|uniref:DNA-binding response regulator n=1 Tax=Pseudomonas arsenicoxydans TaxID=702115 RepID=A0A502I0Q0_9PSED|nr:response regulator transcription factor [Pseudomonas arsenicoxydans]TPG79603.1 DNA-binding response regulator [Pseudomonas arsenicoxydans]
MKWSNLAPLRVALLDDHALIRHGFMLHIAEERDIEVVGAFGSSREMLASLRSVSVDVLVMDYSLQQTDLDGLNLIRLLRIRFPDIRILVFSSTESPSTIALSLRAGVRGFLGKSEDLVELVRAVRTVAHEKIYLSDAVALELGFAPGSQQLLDEHVAAEGTVQEKTRLSPREEEVIRCCLVGMSVSQIALKFNRSRKTISGQKQTAFRKLGVSSEIELYKIRSELGVD